MARYILETERLFARLYDLNNAVAALNDMKTSTDFETVIRVSADVGMMVEAALTPQQSDYMRVSLPILTNDISGRRVRQLKFFDGRFTLEWPYVKHLADKGNAI